MKSHSDFSGCSDLPTELARRMGREPVRRRVRREVDHVLKNTPNK